MFTSDYYLDVTWLKSLSPYLDRFKATSSSERTFNCRCPICGDSKKSKRLARCYFYTSHGSLNVSCKNCGYGRSFYNFMRDVFPDKFDEYKMEQLKSRLGQNVFGSEPVTKDTTPASTPEPNVVTAMDGVVAISNLDNSHKAKQYLLDRCVPVDCFNRLYYADNFKDTASSVSYCELSSNFPDEDRIVIPFYDIDGKITMIQGRSLNPNSNLRYITIKASEDAEKVFGLDVVDFNKTVYVCEGPIDSFFVDNCLASCDSSLTRIDAADVYIWDNEPRNPEIIKLMDAAIDNGKSLVIWPFSPERKVDMNDMIKTGIYSSTRELMQTIQTNTFSGIQAKLKFQQWKRC